MGHSQNAINPFYLIIAIKSKAIQPYNNIFICRKSE